MDVFKLKNHFLLLQMNDALFPIGGYSHSYGLETYIQKGIVHDADTAEKYLKNRLRYTFLYTDLLAVRIAYDAATRKDLKKLDELEDILDASKVPKEIREASQKLGSRFVKTLMGMKIEWDTGIFHQYLEQRRGKSICHPCAYGVFCACENIEKTEALSAFLYAQASGTVTNCVKTIPLSQSAGQKLLFSLYLVFEEILKLAESLGEELLCASSPGFDLRSIQHEQLYSRLYMS